MENQKDVRLSKVKNWENVEMPIEELLEISLQAFNEIPNKRLKYNKVPNTYAIASAIQGYLNRKENQE